MTIPPDYQSPNREAFMSPSNPKRKGGTLLVVIATVGALAACSPGDSADRPATTARACSTPADSIVGLATRAFTRHISPKPHRYLIPVSTDSALPTNAYWALQSTAATLNMYPRDTAQQRQVRTQLGASGAYTMMLVSYHGQRRLNDGGIALDFSGHFMGGDVDGRVVPRTAILFSCHAEGERFVVDSAAPPV